MCTESKFQWNLEIKKSCLKGVKEFWKGLNLKLLAKRIDSENLYFVVEGPSNLDEIINHNKQLGFVSVEKRNSSSVDDFFKV